MKTHDETAAETLACTVTDAAATTELTLRAFRTSDLADPIAVTRDGAEAQRAAAGLNRRAARRDGCAFREV